MNIILKLLYQNKLIRFSDGSLLKWDKNGKIDCLLFAARNGRYQIRLMCIFYLKNHLNAEGVVEQLLEMVKDEIDEVSTSAIKVLKTNNQTVKNAQIAQMLKERKRIMSKKRGSVGIGISDSKQSASVKWAKHLKQNQKNSSYGGGSGIPGF